MYIYIICIYVGNITDHEKFLLSHIVFRWSVFLDTADTTWVFDISFKFVQSGWWHCKHTTHSESRHFWTQTLNFFGSYCTLVRNWNHSWIHSLLRRIHWNILSSEILKAKGYFLFGRLKVYFFKKDLFGRGDDKLIKVKRGGLVCFILMGSSCGWCQEIPA